MAVEIKELVIRAIIKDGKCDNDNKKEQQDEAAGSKQESIIKECVDQVMQILKDKKYR